MTQLKNSLEENNISEFLNEVAQEKLLNCSHLGLERHRFTVFFFSEFNDEAFEFELCLLKQKLCHQSSLNELSIGTLIYIIRSCVTSYLPSRMYTHVFKCD